MEDKRAIFTFLSLFSVFLIFIILSGFFQLKTEEREIIGLFRDQAYNISSYLSNEISRELEYLEVLSTSSSFLLPQMFDIVALDEQIIGDIHQEIFEMGPDQMEKIPLNNIAIFDKNGKLLKAKGDIEVKDSFIRDLLSKKASFSKLGKDSILTGSLFDDLIFFVRIGRKELEELRKIYIIRNIIEREGKGINLLGINIYDNKGEPFILNMDGKENLSFRIPFDSKGLRGYTMEILFSKDPLIQILRKTKNTFFIVLSFFVFFGGILTYFMFIVQKRHEEAMREMTKKMALQERLVSMGKLASGVAHEIKNPLNAIALSIERLKREFLPKENEREYVIFLDIMKKEVLRISKIVEEFLFSTRANLPFKEERLKDLIDEVIMILKEKADKKQIEIINLVSPETFIKCQKERMKQVFFNIIQNSIEAINERGLIRIEDKKKDGKLDIYVNDTGRGIEKEDLGKIFEYYYTTKDKGIGLGLPISYMIIKDHGGSLDVASEKGKGTTFIITLPWNV